MVTLSSTYPPRKGIGILGTILPLWSTDKCWCSMWSSWLVRYHRTRRHETYMFQPGRPCLLCEYAHAEVNFSQGNSRVILKNEYWVALVPWWAIWPFEILRESFSLLKGSKLRFSVLPYTRHITSIILLTDAERTAFASIISQIATRYDNLFQCPFAYSMGIHQRPVPGSDSACDDDSVAHLHIHFDPPLLRSATVKKFLVGCVVIKRHTSSAHKCLNSFELMAEAQRDLTPEQAAERLRNCPTTHYLQSNACRA